MLKRKMLRDIKLNLSQFITIFLMVCIGVMAYSGIESYMEGMEEARRVFYTENNLQDLDVMGSNFTEEDLKEIKKLDNVKNAERKLNVRATTNLNNTLGLSFIETNDISELYILDGIKFNKNKKGIWLDNFYAEANDLKLGDEIELNYDRYKWKEKIVALVNVPDHLYDTKDESELMPDRTKYGFAYLSSNELEGYITNKIKKDKHLTDKDLERMHFDFADYLIFNNVMVDVDEKDNVISVKDDIEEEIDSAIAVIKIEDTASYQAYQGEIDEGKTYVGIFSGLFIFIAMLSVITTMTRVVKKERVEIGTLKALGFKNSKILLHYISYGLLISIVAALLGLYLGKLIIGNLFMSLEMSFFEVPNGVPITNTKSYLVALIVVLLVVLVSYLTCRKTLKKNAAGTLRNEIPNVKVSSLNITNKKVFNKMSFSTKWNIRDMLRNKLRTVTAIVGIAGCAMLIVCALGLLDSLNNFMVIQYEKLYNFDYKLTLEDNIKEKDLEKLKNEYGKATSLGNLIEIKIGDEKKTNNIIVYDNDKDKIRFLDKKENYQKLDNNDGVYITYKLAENEGYEVGDKIKWHLVGNDEYYESEIVGLNRDPQNQNMQMTKEYFESLGNEYNPTTLYTDEDLSDVKEIKNVKTIQSISEIEESMNGMLNNMKTMIVLIVVVAVILGVVIIYNMSILSYTEKQYQYATLKVLGFSDKKVKKIFTKQNNIITLIAVILGLPLGYGLVAVVYKFAVDDQFDLAAKVAPLTYIVAAVGTFLVTYIVSSILSKKINKIDMVSSLKGNE